MIRNYFIKIVNPDKNPSYELLSLAFSSKRSEKFMVNTSCMWLSEIDSLKYDVHFILFYLYYDMNLWQNINHGIQHAYM